MRLHRWTANKYYQEAVKQGLEESLLSLATAEQQQAMAIMGPIDERVVSGKMHGLADGVTSCVDIAKGAAYSAGLMQGW